MIKNGPDLYTANIYIKTKDGEHVVANEVIKRLPKIFLNNEEYLMDRIKRLSEKIKNVQLNANKEIQFRIEYIKKVGWTNE